MTAKAIPILGDDGSRDLTQWVVAGAIVLAAHAAIVASLMMVNAGPRGVPSAPAVMIDMAPPASPEQPMDAEVGPEMVEAQPLPEPDIPLPPPPDLVLDLPPPEPMLETPLVAIPEPPPPEVKPAPKPPEKKPEIKRVEKKPPAPRTAAPQRSERQDAERESRANIGGAASVAAAASWRDMVLSQLQRAKRYPDGAQSRREQGVVTLSFTVSRAGGVLARSIARSSGSSELDQEVLSMVQRAQPFPSFPAGMSQSSTSLTVPIRFSLR